MNFVIRELEHELWHGVDAKLDRFAWKLFACTGASMVCIALGSLAYVFFFLPR